MGKEFTICYAESSGDSSDTTWRDSYVRVLITKIESLAAHRVTHVTDGSLAKTKALELTYSGSLAVNKWVSFVDDTLNAYFPCANATLATTAAASAFSQYSGVSRNTTGTKVVVVNTTRMSSSI